MDTLTLLVRLGCIVTLSVLLTLAFTAARRAHRRGLDRIHAHNAAVTRHLRDQARTSRRWP